MWGSSSVLDECSLSSTGSGGTVLAAGSLGVVLGTGKEVEVSFDLIFLVIFFTVDDLLLYAEAVKEVIETIDRKKMLMKMKRVIEKIL